MIQLILLEESHKFIDTHNLLVSILEMSLQENFAVIYETLLIENLYRMQESR